MELRVSRTREPRGLRLSGEVDVSNAHQLRRALSAEVPRGGDLTLDLAEVAFLDSTGLEQLIRAARDLEGNGRLILVSPQEPIRRLFELVLLDRRSNVEIRNGRA
ncbi:MAG: STAS domain-containing protein [Actinomycetota bacterium]|nr:STAS domain-containing protein [Actinomycetota bacterium]